MGTSDKVRVRFAVDDDELAQKISALLEALGYEAVRELDHGSPQSRLRWAVTRLSTQANLTERERDVLGRVLHGRNNTQIGEELGIRRATVKWHMHNIFTKTGASTREGLLREALQLGNASAKAKAKAKAEIKAPAAEVASAEAPAAEVASAEAPAAEVASAEAPAVEAASAEAPGAVDEQT